MKKIIISITAFTIIFCYSAKAQQKIKTVAVLQRDGSEVLTINDALGKTTTISGKTNAKLQAAYSKLVSLQQATVLTGTKAAEQNLFVPPRAALLQNGNQEIRWTDATGKVRVVTAGRGESIQEKYRLLLKKEGIASGSAPPASTNLASQNAAKTATKQ